MKVRELISILTRMEKEIGDVDVYVMDEGAVGEVFIQLEDLVTGVAKTKNRIIIIGNELILSGSELQGEASSCLSPDAKPA